MGPKRSLCQKCKVCSDPISADPMCPFPISPALAGAAGRASASQDPPALTSVAASPRRLGRSRPGPGFTTDYIVVCLLALSSLLLYYCCMICNIISIVTSRGVPGRARASQSRSGSRSAGGLRSLDVCHFEAAKPLRVDLFLDLGTADPIALSWDMVLFYVYIYLYIYIYIYTFHIINQLYWCLLFCKHISYILARGQGRRRCGEGRDGHVGASAKQEATNNQRTTKQQHVGALAKTSTTSKQQTPTNN